MEGALRTQTLAKKAIIRLQEVKGIDVYVGSVGHGVQWDMVNYE